MKYLKSLKYLDALCVYFWATTPVLMSILTFGTYVLLGHTLTAAKVFTSMALLNMLISPLNAFPWILNGMTEAWVSIKRIQRLLDVRFLVVRRERVHLLVNILQLPDLHLDEYYKSAHYYGPNFELVVKDATFRWAKNLTKEERNKLHSKKKRSKHKGKSKKLLSSEEFDKQLTQVAEKKEEEVDSVFRLNNINLFVKKVKYLVPKIWVHQYTKDFLYRRVNSLV